MGSTWLEGNGAGDRDAGSPGERGGMARAAGGRSAQITIVGAGLAGLCAAIACAEEGAKVRLLEAHDAVGGRARSTEGPYKANLGPHALYSDGGMWAWMRDRQLLPAHRNPRLSSARMRIDGAIRRTPPLEMLPAVLRLRGREAPVDTDFRTWAQRQAGERTAAMLSSAAGVFTFHHDPGSLSAAFIWSRFSRGMTVRTSVRYTVGGWSALVEQLERRVRELGVSVQTGARVDSLPAPPVIIATELGEARRLTGEKSLNWSSGSTLCLDLGVEHRRGDPSIVADFDEAGWIGRYSASNPSVAPAGMELIQSHMPIRPSESADQAGLRLERFLDAALPRWRDREAWRRRQVMDGRSGAVDRPGFSWRDRPKIDRGDGVLIAGDMVAAPGLLSEVSWASALEAARLALDAARPAGRALSAAA